MAYMLSVEDHAAWEVDGCLLLTGILEDDVITSLDGWTNEVAAWEAPPEGVPGLFTQTFELAAGGERVLCRVENYVPFHPGYRRLAEEVLAPLAAQLLGEAAVLYKEKINLKMPGGRGYAPHYDGPSAASTGLASTFITCQVAIDPTTSENGCLEIIRPRAACPPEEMTPPVEHGNPEGDGRVGAIPPAALASATWEPIEAPRGSIFLFHGMLPHRSGPNKTDSPRRTAYMLFNPLREGDQHDAYYAAVAAQRATWRQRAS
jgi:ectoine hydroxylase-related dioxygenase (phytanoyl-CoA dioxygenase family)